jgi:hypothetical protein
MSTVPGPQSWQDAGLVPVDPDEPRRLTDDDAGGPPPEPEEYAPGFPRPDLDDEADEADVVEQDIEVVVDDEADED